MKRKEWYGISVSQESEMIILWESSKEPVKALIGDNLVLSTSRGLVNFPFQRVFKVTSKKSHDIMMDYVKKMKQKVNEWKDYSIQTH